jgi:hypothetical protein
MPAAENNAIAATGVCLHGIFLEAAADILSTTLDTDPYTIADIVWHLNAIPIETRDRFNYALFSNGPPSDFGRKTVGKSSIWAGGNDKPFSGGIRLHAWARAVHSIAGFEPSRKELNILGLKLPILACSAVSLQLSQTVSGVDSLNRGNHLCAPPPATTGKPNPGAPSTKSQIKSG